MDLYSFQALSVLHLLRWPASARGPQITTTDLPPTVRSSGEIDRLDNGSTAGPLPARVAALERRAIEEALATEGGNQSRAAERLGISERALRYKRAKFRDDSSD